MLSCFCSATVCVKQPLQKREAGGGFFHHEEIKHLEMSRILRNLCQSPGSSRHLVLYHNAEAFTPVLVLSSLSACSPGGGTCGTPRWGLRSRGHCHGETV